MIISVSNKVTKYLIESKIVEQDDRDIYMYGTELIISEIICTMITLGIGFLFESFLKTIIYLFVYTLIRVYAGGYHARSHKNCIAIFNGLFLVSLGIVELLYYLNLTYVLVVATLISTFIICVLAPVEDSRKKLDENEIRHYRCKARRRTILCGLLVEGVYFFGPSIRNEIGYGMIAICEVALLVVLGYIKNRRNLMV